MNINQITDVALNVNCSKTKVKTYLVWLSQTWLFFHKASLCTLRVLMGRTTVTEELKFHIQEAKYNLSNLLFLLQKGSASLCSGPRKVNQLTVFLDKLSSKQKVLDHIIYLLNILAHKKVPNKGSSMWYESNINEPTQSAEYVQSCCQIYKVLLSYDGSR